MHDKKSRERRIAIKKFNPIVYISLIERRRCESASARRVKPTMSSQNHVRLKISRFFFRKLFFPENNSFVDTICQCCESLVFDHVANKLFAGIDPNINNFVQLS